MTQLLKTAQAMKSLKVLLVDDDRNVIFTVRAMLNEMEINYIREAKDGREAVDILDETGDQPIINFIICDWNMPHKTGFELLREIRQTHPNIPFLMITGRADKSSVEDAAAAGVTSYLLKPFSFNELQKKIMNMIPSA